MLNSIFRLNQLVKTAILEKDICQLLIWPLKTSPHKICLGLQDYKSSQLHWFSGHLLLHKGHFHLQLTFFSSFPTSLSHSEFALLFCSPFPLTGHYGPLKALYWEHFLKTVYSELGWFTHLKLWIQHNANYSPLIKNKYPIEVRAKNHHRKDFSETTPWNKLLNKVLRGSLCHLCCS